MKTIAVKKLPLATPFVQAKWSGIFTCLLLVLTLSISGAAQVSSYQRPITISHSMVPNTDQTDFPVLISGTYPFLATTANGGQVINPNGYDIFFASDAAGQNRLDFEIDTYNPLTGAVAFWVRLPALSHTSDTTIYIFYGVAGISTSLENKVGVWRNNYLSVYHFGDGQSVALGDSASANYILSQSGSPTAAQGAIGGGVSFNGDPATYLYHDYVTAYPGNQSAVTIEAWAKQPTTSSEGDIVGYGQNGDNGSRIALASIGAMEFENMGIAGSVPPDNNWHQLVGVYGGGALSPTSSAVYVDAVPYTGSDSETPSIATTELKIGGIPTVTFCCAFTGTIDEVRISSGTRTADWIATEYSNQSSPSTFYSMGAQDTQTITPIAPTPTFSLASGTYVTAQQMTISSTLAGATVNYTTDGTIPTASSPAYSGPIVIPSSLTLRAIATASGYSPSAIATAIYTITSPNPLAQPSSLSVSFNDQNIGSASSSQALNYTFDVATILGSISVLTNGTSGLDFASGASTTCIAGNTYNAGDSCGVSVIFTPKYAGDRFGAVILQDNNGNLIATSYLSGVGIGPQVTFQPGSQSIVPANGLLYPINSAVDAGGDVFITDSGNNRIVEETRSGNSYTQNTVPTSTLFYPEWVTLDAAGNIYVADTGNNRILKETPLAGRYLETAVPTSSLSYAEGMAVDGNGNLYIADYGNNRVLMEASTGNGYTESVIPIGDLNGPDAIAVDGGGNIYLTDDNQRVIKETLLGGNYTESIIPTSVLLYAYGIAVDGVGNLYISDTGNGRVLKETLATGTYTESVVPISGVQLPFGVAVDGRDNVYVADPFASNNIVEVNFSDPPSVAFSPTYFGSTSVDSPKTVTVTNFGNTALNFASINYPGDFPEVASSPGDCISATSLVSSTSCALSIDFAPHAPPASLNENVVLTTNALNAVGTQQAVSVTGTALRAMPVLTWATPSPVVYGIALSSTQLNASSGGIPGTFSYSPAAGAIVSSGVKTLSVTFTPTNILGYTPQTASVTLNVSQASPALTWSNPSPVPYGVALSQAQLNASSGGIPGSFTYTPALGTALGLGSHILSATFNPTDRLDYTTASASVTVLVTQATPVVQWPSPAPVTPGTPLSEVQADATASVPGTFAYSPGIGTILAIGTQTLSVTFTPTDSTDYIPVTQTVSLIVAPPLVLPAAGMISTIAGTGTAGYSAAAGVALGEGLNNPTGVAIDSSGNIYVADSQNNVIRKLTASTGAIATVAGNGNADYSGDGGIATSASFDAPSGVALDSAGNIYIADTNNDVVRKVTISTGLVMTVAGIGTPGYGGDGGTATNAELHAPTGVAVDSLGNIYISDAENNAIREVNQSSNSITTVAGTSVAGDSGDGGLATSAEFQYPTSVAVDGEGNLYIADTFNGRIRKVTASTGIVTAFAGHGSWGYGGDGGAAIDAAFNSPSGVAVDAAANVYIADVGNSVIRKVSASTQTISTVAGNGTWGYSGDGGPATGAQLGIDQVTGIAVDASGNIFIADVDNNVIRAVGGVKITPTVIVSASPDVVNFGAATSTFIANVSSGAGTVVFSNGQGWSSAALPVVNGTSTVSLSNVGWLAGIYPITASYSGDALNNASTGATTLAVNSTSTATPTVTWPVPAPIPYGSALSASQLNATASVPGSFVYSPVSGTVPTAGTITLSVLFLPTDSADYNAVSSSVTLTINAASEPMPGPGLIGTVAGNGITGYAGDGGLATSAELTTNQSGIAVDSLGNIYISDWLNNVVRKVNVATWVISTVAGNGTQGYAGDQGPALNAELNGPAGLAIDALGNVYIADTGNNVIREVSGSTGTITTMAGNQTIGYSGDGNSATQAALYYPYSVSVAANGDLYIADTGNSVVRKVTAATGIISTVAGNGTSGYSGDASSATAATLNAPISVAIGTSGNLYIADLSNNNIRVVYASGTLPAITSPTAGDIYTLVGSGTGAAISATLHGPQGVAVDASGNIYIADSNDNVIRAVYASGTLPGISNAVSGSLYTLAGNTTLGYSGDGGLASGAELNGPQAIAVDAYGHVYIADTNNQVIRAVGAIGKATPSITWVAPAAIPYGTPLSALQLNATASAAGTMIYEPSTAAILPVGNQPIAVTFIPANTTDYTVAASNSAVVIQQATPVLTWTAPASIVPGTALSAAQLNAITSVPGSFAYTPALGAIPAAGATTLTVTFTPTDTVDYTSTTASVPLVVQQVSPVISWTAPSPITYGTPLGAAQLSATSSIPGTFTYNVVNGAVLSVGTRTLAVTFTPTDLVGYTIATASVPLIVTQASPAISWAIPAPITYGTPLSAAQLNASASVPGTFVYNPAVGSVPGSGTDTLTAMFTPSDTADYTALSATVSLTVNQILAAGAPVLQLRTSTTPNAVTLSNPVNLDWVVWGADGSTTAATRMANANLISDITPLGGASIYADSNGGVQYSWTGGTPTATGTGVKAEMTTTGAGAGFQITAPADSTVKTLQLYVDINPNAQLSATVSDGSSPAISHSPVTTQDAGYEIYSIDYRAASAGQTLTVQLVSTDSSANVGLQAAVLQPHLPAVSILSPLPGQTFGASGVPVIVNAAQFDASIASVQLISNGAPVTSLSTAPYITTLTPSSGHYVLQAQATDTAGLINLSAPIEFDVIGAGGSLSDTLGQLSSTATVDLTAEGTADWALFGPSNYNNNLLTRKSGVVPLISGTSIISTGPYNYGSFLNNGQLSFEDGTPDPQESGIQPASIVSGNGSPGFQIVVAADTTTRTLRLYSEGCEGNVMSAFLSDGSAPAITDTLQSATGSGTEAQNFYAITYNAASAGQTLTVRQTVPGGGCVILDAASLTGTPTLQAPVVSSISPGSGVAGTVVTINGTGFESSQGSGTVSFGGIAAAVVAWSGGQIQAAVPAGVQAGPVQVVTTVGASNSSVQFTPAPTVTDLTPSNGPIGTVVTITGMGFGSAQAGGSVSFNGTTATPSSWSDTQIVVSVPAGSATGAVAVTQGAAASATPLFTVTSGTQASPLPLIQVGLDTSSKTVNLTDSVNQDWIAYNLGSSQVQFSCGAQGENGGTCSQSGTNLIVVTPQYPAGFQVTAPADTTVRTLKIYSSYTGYDTLNVSISDGSSAPVSFVPQATYDYGEKVFSIDYRAASQGQTVTVQLGAAPAYLYDDRLNVEAVVLQPHLPNVSIVSPITGQLFAAQTSVPMGVDAMQFDSSISSGNISANGSPLYTFNTPGYATTWMPQPGHYALQALAVDSAGLSNASKPVYLDVIGTGGTLGVTRNTPPGAPIDLTTAGTADWIMFEDCSNQTDAGPVRKAGVAPLISTLSTLGDQLIVFKASALFDASGFAYEDGTPDIQQVSTQCAAEAANGVAGNGLEFKVNADTVPRTLHLYAGTYNARGKLRAFLSDGSAPVIAYTSVVGNQDDNSQYSNYASAAYNISFSAASPGQTLTIQWTMDTVTENYGYVELFGAALDGAPVAPAQGPVVHSMTPVSGAMGTVVTISGTGFGTSQGSSTVTFNGVTATPTSWSDTQIQVPAPSPDNPGNVVVTVSGIASDPEIFSMPTSITGLSSSSGVAGSTLTINGVNFGVTQGTSSVCLYNCDLSVVSWSDTQIQIIVPFVPSWALSNTVSVNPSNGSSSNNFPFTIIQNQITPTIQWPAPSAFAYGTALSTTQLDATASVPGTFVYSPAIGTVLNAGTYSLTATFNPTDTASYTTATAQIFLDVTQLTPAISWPAPLPITYGAPLSSSQLNATASVPGIFVYNPPLGAILNRGLDTLSLTFTPADAVDYASVTSTVSLSVSGGKQGIEVPPPGMIATIAGDGTAGSSGDSGQSTNAALNSPFGVAVDSSGNVYIADTMNSVVREVNASTGVISTVAGNYTAGYAGDGTLAVNSALNGPYGVAVDAAGNLYIADTGNEVIRQVNASTGIITTVVGDGSGRTAYAGDGGPATAAELNSPTGVAVDLTGNIYIADWMNNAIRQVNASTGVITTLAGDGTGKAAYLGDGGPATSAELNQPFGVAVDLTSGNATSGTVYIADTYNNRIRAVNPTSQIITTVAGTGTAGYGGDNGLATSAALADPLGVAVDASGNLFIADWLNNAVREVMANTGVITTVAGYGLAGDSGDGGQGVNAKLNGPAAVATDALGVLATGQSQGMATPQARVHPLFQGGCSSSVASGGGDVYIADTGNNATRLLGDPSLNTPPFLVPAGQFLAWSYPSNSSDTGEAADYTTGTSASGSFYGAGSITWTGFTMPALPANAVIQGIYAVEGYDATCLNSLSADLMVNGGEFSSVSASGIGVGSSQTLGTLLPSSMGATVTGSGEGSLDITSAAAAVTYTIPPQPPSPPGGCEVNSIQGCGHDPCPYANSPLGTCCPPASVANGTCTLPTYPPPTFTALQFIDPYLLSSNSVGLDNIDRSTVLSAASTANAAAIIADGTSTAIAFIGVDLHGGPPLTGVTTFIATNGATLAPWDPSFLTHAPGAASTSNSGIISLDVPATDFVQNSDGLYYALVLVTAGTPATSAVSQATTVIVEAPGLPSASLQTLPVPVVLVHGLWGNKSSLASTTKFLKSNTPLGSYPGFVMPICYSTYLSFAATVDDLEGAGRGCEVTSTSALSTYLKSLYATLDKNHYVGGRVDIVAHSMGGLVARNYATLGKGASEAGFANERNHFQGTFRDVVTLDTPETGSALASWLDFTFAAKTKAQDAKSHKIWDIMCGLSLQKTVRECMQSELFGLVHQPLAPPADADTIRGAVYSLIPGGPDIQQLPNPNIPNSQWYAIASDFPDDGQLPTSLVRNYLEDFFGATYPAAETPLTFNYMQGNVENSANQVTEIYSPDRALHNDVIVTLDSQLYDATTSATFPGLSHTSIPIVGGLVGLLTGASNAAVTNNDSVNSQITVWLGYPPSLVPAPTPDLAAAETSKLASPGPKLSAGAANLEPSGKEMFAADERLTATMPTVPAELGQSLQIPLNVLGGDLSTVIVAQNNATETFQNENATDGTSVGSGEARIISDTGITKTIEIIPLQTGTVNLDITALFADGGVAHRAYSLLVGPSSKGIKKFLLNGGLSTVTISLDGDDPHKQVWLAPEVEYEGLEDPIYLSDSQQVKLTVEQQENDPIISLDSDGMVHAIRPGRAIISGEFGGIKDSVTVQINAK